MKLHDLFPVIRDGIHVLPVLHERLESADTVRLAAALLEPDGVALEIPSSLERTWTRGVARLPQISVLLYENVNGQTIYLPIHPLDPLAEAARFAAERGARVCCADLDVDGYADYRDRVPDSYAVLRLGLNDVFGAFRERPRRRDPQDARRESCMAFHARKLREEGCRRVLLVCGMHHVDGVASELQHAQAIPLTPPERKSVRLVHLHPDSLGEVLGEPPFYAAAYEARRHGVPPEPQQPTAPAAGRSYGPFRVLSGGHGDDPERIRTSIVRAAREGNARRVSWSGSAASLGIPGPLDRLRLQWVLLRQAERALSASAPDEDVRPWQRKNLARFARNLALFSGQLVVDLYDLLAAARSCVSDNYAWEVHRLAVAYPEQMGAARDLPTARIRADELFDGVRRIRLQRRIRQPKRPDWSRLLRRRRMDERWPGEWLEGFDENAICSHPPEDLLVENFGRYLKQRGRSVLSEEQARTVPFTTSVLDGIDVRETIRNWHERRIMVRELSRVPGDVGSVVCVFDEDRDEGERFPYCQTWHGEHEQESDMAFYSTDPAQGIVGPGICRVTYGGFLLSYPPRRMADTWSDPDYRLARCKSEVLLLAALDYSTQPIVVYVAAKPPRAILSELARKLGLKILYLPLGSLSPTTLKRVRVMHILHGREKREVAKDYIW